MLVDSYGRKEEASAKLRANWDSNPKSVDLRKHIAKSVLDSDAARDFWRFSGIHDRLS